MWSIIKVSNSEGTGKGGDSDSLKSPSPVGWKKSATAASFSFVLLCAYFSPTDINKTDHLYTWSSTDQFTAATLSGPSLYYNTLGDRSNCRCVPFHKEKRYEMYALEDIPAGTELTMRYDSMNWRDAMQEVKQAVGELKGAHNQAT